MSKERLLAWLEMSLVSIIEKMDSNIEPIDLQVQCDGVEAVEGFCYFGDRLSTSRG